MTSDHDLQDYLSARSAQIELPHAGLDRIRSRAKARRHRRRAVGGGLAAVLLLGGVALAVNRPDEGQPMASTAAAVVVPSTLEWSTVDTAAGLGESRPIVAEDGTIYALSTAPGAESPAAGPAVIYRSADGDEWDQVAMPDGLFASSIAVGDGALYALGTTAAGGTTGPVDLAVSTDGGQAWASATVPFDPAAEDPDFPGAVVVRGTEVATLDGRTVVVVDVKGQVDVESLLGPDDDPSEWWVGDGGLVRMPHCVDGSTATGAVPSSTMAPPVDDATQGDLRDELEASGQPCDEDDIVMDEQRSWDELGLDAEAQALAAGYAVVLAGPTGGELTRVQDIPGSTWAGPRNRSLVVADDGLWILRLTVGDDPSAMEATAWHSADGASWAPVEIAPTHGVDIGVLDGQAVFFSWYSPAPPSPPAPVLHRLSPSGATAIDLSGVLNLPAEADFISLDALGFGPLGMALVVSDADTTRVVTTPDGQSFSVQEVPLEEMAGADRRAIVNGVTVTADAVKVRVNLRDVEDLSGGVPSAQRLFVGTPA